MTEKLTLRDIDMLRDAVFEQAGSARSSREEDRWLALDRKLYRMKSTANVEMCRCGHRRVAHLRGDVVTTCEVCRCQSFDRQ